MRISTSKNDPGYCHFIPGIGVTVDGVEVSDEAVTADDEAGEVVAYKKDAQGNYVIDGDEFAVETLRGKVVITLPPGAAIVRP